MMTHHQLSSEKLIKLPNLSRSNHRVTSDPAEEYNCIAWVAGDTTRRWFPYPGYYWPPGVLRDDANIQSFIDAFAQMGYAVCADGTLESGYEKIAFYVHPTEGPTHAALQLPSGRWTSKLGREEDIEHDSEHDVEGNCRDCYGVAHTYMRRTRASQRAETQGSDRP